MEGRIEQNHKIIVGIIFRGIRFKEEQWGNRVYKKMFVVRFGYSKGYAN